MAISASFASVRLSRRELSDASLSPSFSLSRTRCSITFSGDSLKNAVLRTSASNSLNDLCRLSGFFANIFKTIRSISGVTVGLYLEGAGAGSVRCFFIKSFGVYPANGVLPVSSSNSVIPKL